MSPPHFLVTPSLRRSVWTFPRIAPSKFDATCLSPPRQNLPRSVPLHVLDFTWKTTEREMLSDPWVKPGAGSGAGSDLTPQHAAEHPTGDTATGGVMALVVLEVVGQRRSEDGDGHALEPDVARTGQLDQVVAVGPHVPVGDPGQPDHRETHGVLEQPRMAGMDEQALAGGELVGGHLARELDPRLALAF